MSEYEMRLQCLRLATKYDYGDAVKRAREYYDFLTDKSDSKIIEAARNLAKIANE